MDLITAGVVLAILIIAHHIYIHPEYDFPDRAFQISDVQNHETWVVASLALAVGAYFASTYITSINFLVVEKPHEQKHTPDPTPMESKSAP